jgi:hypothetical protein
MLKIQHLSALLLSLLITACASLPSGPSFMALPGSGKNFSQFRVDDNQCRLFAHEQVNSTSPEQFSEQVNQQRYDMSYVQCMYKKNHRVPVYGQFTNDPAMNNNDNPNRSIPPPPPGKPPPPPPG